MAAACPTKMTSAIASSHVSAPTATFDKDTVVIDLSQAGERRHRHRLNRRNRNERNSAKYYACQNQLFIEFSLEPRYADP